MIRFGPSGNAREFYEQGKKNSEEAPEWLARRGLNAYEYSFGRGINISDKKANAIRDAAAAYDVEVSVHAPYYINFSNPDDAMAEKSYDTFCARARNLRKWEENAWFFIPQQWERRTGRTRLHSASTG